MALPAHAVFALSGLGSAWAVGAAAASRGFGGAPLPESLRGPEPPGLLTLDFLAGRYELKGLA